MSAMTCSNCGLPNAVNASACARCGAPLGARAPQSSWAPPSPYHVQPQKGRSTTKTVILVLVCVLGGGFVLVSIVAAIAIPSLIRARAAANESAAIGTLRMLASAEATYASRNKNTYGTLAELRRDNYIDPGFTDGLVRNGYTFREVKVNEYGFEFSAEPTSDTTSGDRAFNVVQDFVIRYNTGKTAPRGTSGTELAH